MRSHASWRGTRQVAWWLLAALLAVATAGCGGRASQSPAPVISSSDDPGYYTVQAGDSIYSIAWGLELDYRSLARWNNLQPPYSLNAGDRLKLNSSAAPAGRGKPSAGRTLKEVSRNPSGSIEREVPARFLDWRSGVDVLPEPRSALRWIWPTAGKAQRVRSGIEIRGQLGQPVIAAEGGTVVYSGDGLKGYGNLVIIKHRGDYLTAYGFNRRVVVAEGDRVGRGDAIGEMGEGKAGAALYFEIRRSTIPQEPLSLLPKR